MSEGAFDRVLSNVRPEERNTVAATACNRIEDRRLERDLQLLEALDRLWQAGLERAHVIGITGPPGAGKSTLLDRLVFEYVQRGRSVAVLAVDPSSAATGGAVLGDEARIGTTVPREKYFLRSLANRSQLGGISDRVFHEVTMLRVLFDIVFVETVGVGQSETEISSVVDSTLLVIQPASGDSLQCLKQGVMEFPDLVAVNKGDIGALARKTLVELESTIAISRRDRSWIPKPTLCSALRNIGIDSIVAALDSHREFRYSQLLERRREQAVDWMWRTLRSYYGSRGSVRIVSFEREVPRRTVERCLERLRDKLIETVGPFQALEVLSRELDI